MKRRIGLVLYLLMAVLPLLVACGGGAETPPGPQPKVSPTPLCSGDLCLLSADFTGSVSQDPDAVRALRGWIHNTGQTRFPKVEITFSLYD